MVKPEILKKLKESDWSDILPRLVLYAEFKVRRLYWRTKEKNTLPDGSTAEDLAQQAIELVFSGDRRWAPDKNPDILLYLKGVVDSLVSHAVKSYEHRYRDQYDEDSEHGVSLDDLSDKETVTPYDELLEKDILKFLYDNSKDDNNLQLIILCLEEGISKPKVIAETLKIPVSEVNNCKKKIRRLIDKYNKK